MIQSHDRTPSQRSLTPSFSFGPANHVSTMTPGSSYFLLFFRSPLLLQWRWGVIGNTNIPCNCKGKLDDTIPILFYFSISICIKILTPLIKCRNHAGASHSCLSNLFPAQRELSGTNGQCNVVGQAHCEVDRLHIWTRCGALAKRAKSVPSANLRLKSFVRRALQFSSHNIFLCPAEVGEALRPNFLRQPTPEP
jgi:hypothetical protein